VVTDTQEHGVIRCGDGDDEIFHHYGIVFKHCPWLLRDSTRQQDLNTLITEWKTHKFKKPVRGAIILNQDMTKVNLKPDMRHEMLTQRALFCIGMMAKRLC
jgi:hypothetical protein